MKEFALTARDRLTVVGFTLTIVVDTLMYRLLGLLGYRTAEISLIIFGLLLGFYAICQHLSLRLVKGLSQQGLSASRHAQLFRKIQIGVILTQYLLLFLLLIILLDVVITSGYSIVLLEGMVWLSYGSTCVLLSILVRRLISWYRVRPDNVVLFYTVAIGFLALNIILTPLYLSRDLGNVPEEIKFLKQSGMPFSSADNYYYEPYIFTSIFSYLATWFASIMLLRHFSLKIGKAKYILISILPLLYFGSQFQIQFLDIFSGFRAADPVLFNVFYTIVFTAVKPVGGILFGFAFWIIARSLDDQRMKFYLNTAGIGIMLIFIANQPQGLNIAPYPPFGLIAICSLPMGAFLILGGIYTSALAIAQDNSLRQRIKSSVTLKTDLLDKIGSSELDLEIEAKVSQIQRKVVLEPYKLDEPPSDELIKEYIKEVIEELDDKSKRRQNDS